MLYATGSNNALSFNGFTKSCLLAIDNNDQVYIGDVNRNNNIDKIYYGTLGGTWNTIILNTPVIKTRIIVAKHI